jgi:hypothetical protein
MLIYFTYSTAEAEISFAAAICQNHLIEMVDKERALKLYSNFDMFNC